MKQLLSWMRTIKQHGLHQSKEFKGLRAQVSSQVQDIRTNSFSFSGLSHDLNPLETDEELQFDEDGFSGFLAIGTLGRDPETPKFPASVTEENVTGAQKEMAELITEKLDKFREEYPVDGRSKQVERSNAGGDVCPTQDYDLFPLSTQLTKQTNEVKKKKGLLKSLFMRRKTLEGECDSMEKHGTRGLVKRMFRKLHRSSSKKRNDDEDDDYMFKKKDPKKSAQIFRSKVHPVLFTPARDEIDEKQSCTNHCNLNGGFLVPSSISEANKKREHWIKTDAEYHVLEL